MQQHFLESQLTLKVNNYIGWSPLAKHHSKSLLCFLQACENIDDPRQIPSLPYILFALFLQITKPLVLPLCFCEISF